MLLSKYSLNIQIWLNGISITVISDVKLQSAKLVIQIQTCLCPPVPTHSPGQCNQEHHCKWLHHLLMRLVLSSMTAPALDGLQGSPQIKHSPITKLGGQRSKKCPLLYEAVNYTPLPCSALLLTPWGMGNRAHQSHIQSCLCKFSLINKSVNNQQQYPNLKTTSSSHSEF